jgi:hypothetical protein
MTHPFYKSRIKYQYLSCLNQCQILSSDATLNMSNKSQLSFNIQIGLTNPNPHYQMPSSVLSNKSNNYPHGPTYPNPTQVDLINFL